MRIQFLARISNLLLISYFLPELITSADAHEQESLTTARLQVNMQASRPVSQKITPAKTRNKYFNAASPHFSPRLA